MIEYPSLYVKMLQNTGRDDEVDSWNSAKNITDYTENVFKPYLARIDDLLHKGKTATFN